MPYNGQLETIGPLFFIAYSPAAVCSPSRNSIQVSKIPKKLRNTCLNPEAGRWRADDANGRIIVVDSDQKNGALMFIHEGSGGGNVNVYNPFKEEVATMPSRATAL